MFILIINKIDYYSKAFKLAPEDPIINLSLGIVHLHRAMQRQADNRHLQIMQVNII